MEVAVPVTLFVILPLLVIAVGVTLFVKSSHPAVRAMAAALITVGALPLILLLLAIAEVLRDPTGFMVMLPFMGFGAVAFIFWVWMLAECALYEPDHGNEKLVWVLIIIFTNLVGAGIYFWGQRPRRLARAESRGPSE